MTKLHTIPEAAEILRIAPERLYEIAARGDIPVVRLSERRLRITDEALDDWIAERTVAATRESGP
jgi:excisionase family DNA binding protein